MLLSDSVQCSWRRSWGTENDDSIFDDEHNSFRVQGSVQSWRMFASSWQVLLFVACYHAIECSTCWKMLVSTDLTPRDDACDSQFLMLKDRGGLMTHQSVSSHSASAEQEMRTLVSSIHDLPQQCAHLNGVVMHLLNATGYAVLQRLYHRNSRQKLQSYM